LVADPVLVGQTNYIRHYLSAGPARFDAVLQGKEAAGSTWTGLDELLETSQALTQVLGDAEDWTIPITPPDDVPELIMSVEESDLCFAKLDGLSGEERVTIGEEGTGIRGPVSDSRPGLGPATALVQEMLAERAVDTPALLKVFFPGLDLVAEPKTTNGHTLRQVPAANDVGNDQRLDDCQSPSRGCPNCGVKGDRTHSKDTCPARNKDCFSCGIRGHYGRMCRKSKGQLAIGTHAPEKPWQKKASAHEGCPWCGTLGRRKVHLPDACPAQGKDCFNCGIEGHFGRLCRKKKETPVDDADTVRAPMETLDPAGGI
jgi:hypothetical protein